MSYTSKEPQSESNSPSTWTSLLQVRLRTLSQHTQHWAQGNPIQSCQTFMYSRQWSEVVLGHEGWDEILRSTRHLFYMAATHWSWSKAGGRREDLWSWWKLRRDEEENSLRGSKNLVTVVKKQEKRDSSLVCKHVDGPKE